MPHPLLAMSSFDMMLIYYIPFACLFDIKVLLPPFVCFIHGVLVDLSMAGEQGGLKSELL